MTQTLRDWLKRCANDHPMRPGYIGCEVMSCTENWLGATPVSDPAETLALIAEHRLTVAPHEGGWWVTPPDDPALLVDERCEYGSTIGDAVRACVARIREAK